MNPDIGKIDEPAIGMQLIETDTGHEWFRDVDGYWYCFCEDVTDEPWTWVELVADVGPNKNSYRVESYL